MTPHRRWTPYALVAILLATALLPALAAAVPRPAASDVLAVDATSALMFTPDALSVTPGQLVELEVTQLANFNHTFTLSSVANYTIPTTDTPAQLDAFFIAHPPLVNLSLGDVPGVTSFTNFTAPSAGTYEFVCQIPTHFQTGMHGVLTSGTPSTSSSSGLSTTTLLAIVGIVVVVIVVIGVVLMMRRRPAPPAAK